MKLLTTTAAAALALGVGLLASGAAEAQSRDQIRIVGSSTVYPFTTAAAENFGKGGQFKTPVVESTGTGGGLKLFCGGVGANFPDAANASRAIKKSEFDDCAKNGVTEIIELKIGFDGISVLTNPGNSTIECLSFADLYALVGPESDGFADWSDAQTLATELGSTTTFPDASLDITAPGTESGTYDSFIEIALADIAEERVTAGALSESDAESTRSDYTSQSNDNAILQAIEGSDSSFGWVGFAFAEEAGDSVKEIAISEEPGGECIAPTPETIADGTAASTAALIPSWV